VHRDVKPANLFVTTAGGETDFVKVLDFGIAKLDLDAEGLTRAGEVPGTPKYMAPEVILGGPATPRSDVYGLGAVLYTLLAARPPFEGTQAPAVYLAQLTEAPVPPSARRGSALPEELDLITLRCLEREPERRFADAGGLADALAPFAAGWRPPRAAPEAAVARRATDDFPTVVGSPSAAGR
jgi:serine/threonine-protein kinase